MMDNVILKFLNVFLLACILIMIVLTIYLVYLLVGDFYVRHLDYKTFSDIAIVDSFEYKRAHTTTTMLKVGNVMVPQIRHHNEEYNVWLEYKGELYCIDDEELFNDVEENEKVRVWVNKGYNKKGKVKHIFLSIDSED